MVVVDHSWDEVRELGSAMVMGTTTGRRADGRRFRKVLYARYSR